MTTDPNPTQPQPADRPLVEAWGVRSRKTGALFDASTRDEDARSWGAGEFPHLERVPLVAADRLEDDELVEAVVQHVRQRGSLRRRDAVRVLAALRAHLEGK